MIFLRVVYALLVGIAIGRATNDFRWGVIGFLVMLGLRVMIAEHN
jgi:hypothetical protein